MAGHSKWSNIKHRKGRQDEKKGKVFTKISKEIFQAVRDGGEDVQTNTNLRLALDKARQANMPNENIDRTIKKATGNLEGVTYEDIIYEGYAPHGVAIYVQVLTDNKNRSAAEVRLAFNKNNGNLGETGCVAFMFQRKGVLILENTDGIDEDSMMLEAIEAGAEDVVMKDEIVEVITPSEILETVKSKLTQAFSLKIEVAEVAMIPDNFTPVEEEKSHEVITMIEALEDSDDVQEVYHNLDIIPNP